MEELRDKYERILLSCIDDIVPTEDRDTELIISKKGLSSIGFRDYMATPKSLYLLEYIVHNPDEAAKRYPELKDKIPDIVEAYEHMYLVIDNPCWILQSFVTMKDVFVKPFDEAIAGKRHIFISRKNRKEDGVPIVLHYGDITHTHDFVGVVYMCALEGWK